MKKTLLIVGLTVLALGALGVYGVRVAFAQGELPPMPMRGQGGQGWMHEYVQQAFAAKLGLTVEQVQEQLAAGKPMVQIALENGIEEADVTSFMNDVHKEAFDQAVKDGVVTRERADWMLQRMQNMQQNGYGPGNCPMHNGQGSTFERGRGMMSPGMGGGRGWMWGQGSQTP